MFDNFLTDFRGQVSWSTSLWSVPMSFDVDAAVVVGGTGVHLRRRRSVASSISAAAAAATSQTERSVCRASSDDAAHAAPVPAGSRVRSYATEAAVPAGRKAEVVTVPHRSTLVACVTSRLSRTRWPSVCVHLINS